jgi:hypothetical protein
MQRQDRHPSRQRAQRHDDRPLRGKDAICQGDQLTMRLDKHFRLSFDIGCSEVSLLAYMNRKTIGAARNAEVLRCSHL